jgi:Protein of unknown function (DUF3795)
MSRDHDAYDEIAQRLAPCGIDCGRCIAYERGEAAALSRELKAVLEGFGEMAQKVADRKPALAGYAQFQAVLDLLASAACPACRVAAAGLPFCAARVCHREKAVDFCFQCNEYPCDRNDYPDNLASRWRTINDRMREVGVDVYYRESLGKPRY